MATAMASSYDHGLGYITLQCCDVWTYEIVTGSRKRLHCGHLVREHTSLLLILVLRQVEDEEKRQEPHEDKVNNEWNEDSENRADVGDNVLTLVGEEDENGVKKTQKSQWTKEGKELLLEELLAGQLPHDKASDDAGCKGDTEILHSISQNEIRPPKNRELTIKTEIATFP